MFLKHRNSQKRIIIKDCVYFVTTKTYNNHPFFIEPLFGDLFVENLKLCKQLKGFDLYAWFLGYDHFHLLLKPNGEFGLSEIIQFLKRHVTRNINIIIGNQQHKTPSEGDIGQYRLQNDEQFMIQNFDNYVSNLKTQFQTTNLNHNPTHTFNWQKSYHDHFIRNKRDFNNHWEYIKYNPIKHNLPSDWKYHFLNPNYENLIDNPF